MSSAVLIGILTLSFTSIFWGLIWPSYNGRIELEKRIVRLEIKMNILEKDNK